MAFKPNYNFQKAERNRAKALKKQEKLKRKQAARAEEAGASTDADAGADAVADTGADAVAPADKAPGDA